MSQERFISEPMNPVGPPIDLASMARGEPGMPAAFQWRSRTFQIDRVLDRHKESGPCRNGSAERYLRRHRYRILTTAGQTLEVYFERQARAGQNPRSRWFLYTLTEPPPPPPPPSPLPEPPPEQSQESLPTSSLG